MLEGYQAYIGVDTFGVVFKRQPEGRYQGYCMITRNDRAVMLPLEDGLYLTVHMMIDKAAKAFEEMEKGEEGKVAISGGFIS